jgi:hypothetical protein
VALTVVVDVAPEVAARVFLESAIQFAAGEPCDMPASRSWEMSAAERRDTFHYALHLSGVALVAAAGGSASSALLWLDVAAIEILSVEADAARDT